MKTYPDKFPNFDYNLFDAVRLSVFNTSNALDKILEFGWCALRIDDLGNFFIQLPLTKRVTKAQEQSILDANVKHNIKVDLSFLV